MECSVYCSTVKLFRSKILHSFFPFVWMILTPYCAQRVQILSIFYYPVSFFAKLSIFLFFHRIFSPNQRTRYMIYVGIAVTAVFQLGFMLYNISICTLRRGETYLKVTLSQRCLVTAVKVATGFSSINFAIDFYILYIPLQMVWGLQLSAKKKIGFSAIFLTGLL